MGGGKGCEFKRYVNLSIYIIIGGIIYRLYGYYIGLDMYDWLYANIIPCADLFLLGMVGCRLLKYCPVITDDKNKRLLIIVSSIFMILILGCCANIFIPQIIYILVTPPIYGLLTIWVIILCSVRPYHVKNVLLRRICDLCNVVSPYSFMFYLWHSPMLFYIGNTLCDIEPLEIRYVMMLITGFLISCYISYLFTNMNDGVIKKILNK